MKKQHLLKTYAVLTLALGATGCGPKTVEPTPCQKDATVAKFIDQWKDYAPKAKAYVADNQAFLKNLDENSNSSATQMIAGQNVTKLFLDQVDSQCDNAVKSYITKQEILPGYKNGQNQVRVAFTTELPAGIPATLFVNSNPEKGKILFLNIQYGLPELAGAASAVIKNQIQEEWQAEEDLRKTRPADRFDVKGFAQGR